MSDYVTRVDMTDSVDTMLRENAGRWPVLAVAWEQRKPAHSVRTEWLYTPLGSKTRVAEYGYLQMFRERWTPHQHRTWEHADERRRKLETMLDDIEMALQYGIRELRTDLSRPVTYMGGRTFYGHRATVGALRWLSRPGAVVEVEGVPSEPIYGPVVELFEESDSIGGGREFWCEIGVEFYPHALPEKCPTCGEHRTGLLEQGHREACRERTSRP